MKHLKIAGIAALCGQIAAILFLFLISLFLQKSDEPFRAALFAVAAAGALGGAVCGLIVGSAKKESGAAAGWIAGGLMILATLLISFLPGRSGAHVPLTIAVLLFEGFLPPLLAWLLGRARGKRGARRHARRRYAGR